MSGFTPGPWIVASSGLVMGNGGLNNVALPYTYRDEPALTEANARLIAAGPDLLAFCLAVRDRYNTDDRMGGLGDWLNQVIAKAIGTEQTA